MIGAEWTLVAVHVVACAAYLGSVRLWLVAFEWAANRGKRRCVVAAPPPLSPHVGAYRTNPRPQPSLPRKTPWWRLALWWARGGPRGLKRRTVERQTEVEVADVRLEGARVRLYDHDGASVLMDFDLPTMADIQRVRVERASPEVDCAVCCAVTGEPCCPNEH